MSSFRIRLAMLSTLVLATACGGMEELSAVKPHAP